MPATTATVRLWGTDIGAVAIGEGERVATFQYTPELLGSGIEPAPVVMPVRRAPYAFPALPEAAFHGLPGMLADSLPDRYGTRIVNAWLAAQGRTPESINVVERLCYQGTRGMGALEYRPARGPVRERSAPVDVAALVDLANRVLSDRQALRTRIADGAEEDALREILAVGTSAGGARAKAVIAWNPTTNEVRSGQIDAGPGFEHWLLKFDGVDLSGDRGLADPQGYGAIEYGYSLMARDAGIAMNPCRLLEEHGRRHFMTKRFDRTGDGDKLHAQTLGGLAHFDYDDPTGYSYEQAFLVMRELRLPAEQRVEQLRRMIFNVVARNQDDHVKNISFLMDRAGTWRLAPAYDVTYAYRPGHRWLAHHQMSVNGQRDDIALPDIRQAARVAGVRRTAADELVQQITDSVRRWPEFAARAGVPDEDVRRIAPAHRLDLAVR